MRNETFDGRVAGISRERRVSCPTCRQPRVEPFQLRVGSGVVDSSQFPKPYQSLVGQVVALLMDDQIVEIDVGIGQRSDSVPNPEIGEHPMISVVAVGVHLVPSGHDVIVESTKLLGKRRVGANPSAAAPTERAAVQNQEPCLQGDANPVG